MNTASLVPEIVRDTQRFDALCEAWDDLAMHQGPLARHAWYKAALAALQGQPFSLSIVTMWDGDRLAAAAPLMLDKSLSPARLVPIDAFAGEPDRLLYRDSAALAQACARLRRPILFRRLAASRGDLATVSGALRSNAAVQCGSRHASAIVHLLPSFETFEAGMSNSRRSTIRRKWRAAKRDHGGIGAEFVIPGPDDLPRHLARIEAIEGTGWKGRSGTALADDPRMGVFVSQVAHTFAGQGNLVLAFLRIGGHDAACRLILRQESAWFEIKIGYGENFARFSPGVLLMHKTLREACRTGIDNYAFLGIGERWQDHWPNDVIEDSRLATYPFSLSGGRALVADGRQAVRSLARRWRG